MTTSQLPTDPATRAADLRIARNLHASAVMRRDAEVAAVERLDELIADLSTDPAEPNTSAERVETPNATEPSGVAGPSIDEPDDGTIMVVRQAMQFAYKCDQRTKVTILTRRPRTMLDASDVHQ